MEQRHFILVFLQEIYYYKELLLSFLTFYFITNLNNFRNRSLGESGLIKKPFDFPFFNWNISLFLFKLEIFREFFQKIVVRSRSWNEAFVFVSYKKYIIKKSSCFHFGVLFYNKLNNFRNRSLRESGPKKNV